MHRKTMGFLLFCGTFVLFALLPSWLPALDLQATLDSHNPLTDGGSAAATAASAPGTNQTALEKTLAALQDMVKRYEKLLAELKAKLGTAASGTPGRTTAGTVQVSTSLNIRAEPWGKILGGFVNGDQVQIVAKEGEWFKIKHENGFAYVHSRYVKAAGFTSAPTVTPPSTGTTSKPTSGNQTSGPPSSGQQPPPPQVSGNRTYVEVPKYTQFESANGEYQNSWCGPTSLRMVYQYFGRRETTRSIANRIYVKGSGTSASAICSDARKHGFPGTILKEGASIDFLKQMIKAGKPVICNVDVNWKSGHHLVVVGFDGDNVIVNDPGRSAVRRTFSISWFLAQWNGRSRRCVVVQK